jgi:hypothetical protein
MSEKITAEQAAALRKPFPPESIGKLPKGGVTLDFVGHAVTTSRLLTVDPEWTWEPMAVDEHGNPQPDAAGNLWIRLTVCGVTRIGVGDGNTMKIRIGDAIRNAAMRFGVALDLWTKEELEGEPSEHPPPEKKAERISATPPDDPYYDTGPQTLPMSGRSRGRMFALFAEHHIFDPAEQRAGMEKIVGHPVTSRGEITEGECQAVIAVLAARPKPTKPGDPS